MSLHSSQHPQPLPSLVGWHNIMFLSHSLIQHQHHLISNNRIASDVDFSQSQAVDFLQGQACHTYQETKCALYRKVAEARNMPVALSARGEADFDGSNGQGDHHAYSAKYRYCAHILNSPDLHAKQE